MNGQIKRLLAFYDPIVRDDVYGGFNNQLRDDGTVYVSQPFALHFLASMHGNCKKKGGEFYMFSIENDRNDEKMTGPADQALRRYRPVRF